MPANGQGERNARRWNWLWWIGGYMVCLVMLLVAFLLCALSFRERNGYQGMRDPDAIVPITRSGSPVNPGARTVERDGTLITRSDTALTKGVPRHGFSSTSGEQDPLMPRVGAGRSQHAPAMQRVWVKGTQNVFGKQGAREALYASSELGLF